LKIYFVDLVENIFQDFANSITEPKEGEYILAKYMTGPKEGEYIFSQILK
jgi:hypothetical protein